MPSTGRIQESRNQEVEAGAVPLISTPSDPLGDSLLPTSTTLGSGGLVSGPKQDTLLPGNTARVLMNYKLQLPPGHLEFLVPRD